MRKYDRFYYILQSLRQLSNEQLEVVLALLDHFQGYSHEKRSETCFDIAGNDDYPF